MLHIKKEQKSPKKRKIRQINPQKSPKKIQKILQKKRQKIAQKEQE